MKVKKSGFLLLAITWSAILQAQQQFTNNEQEVQQAVVGMFEALSNRDSVSLKAHCTADVIFYEYGQVWTIDTLVNRAIVLNTAVDFKRSNFFSFIDTKTDEHSAWVTYRLQSVFIRDGKQTTAEWLETVVLYKQQNRWRIQHLHSTLLKRN